MTDHRLALIVEFQPARGKAAELREALLDVVEPTRAEDGCLLYDLHEVEDTDVLAFYEVWETPAHHAAHDATPHIIDLVTRMPELTEEPPRMRKLHRIEPGD